MQDEGKRLTELAQWCADQCRQLEGQDFFANAKAGIGLLIKTLIRHADNRAHIERMITTWIESTRQMLHPSDVPGLAQRTNEREKLPAACAICDGYDYILVTVNGNEGAARCQCARGRRLAELDKITREAQPRTTEQPIAIAIPLTVEPERAGDDYQAMNRPERFEVREKPPQLISAEEVEAARIAEMERRRKRDTIQ